MGRRRANHSAVSSSSSAVSSTSSVGSDIELRTTVKKGRKSNPSKAYVRHRHPRGDKSSSYGQSRYDPSVDNTEIRTKHNGMDWLKDNIHVPTLIVISFIAIVALMFTFYPKEVGNDSTELAPVYRVSILEKMPHNTNSFTQGLAYDDDEPGVLYESTGLYGKSQVSRVHIGNGTAFQSVDINSSEFGEGLTFQGLEKNRLVQVLWKSGQGNVFDRYTLEHLYSFEALDLKDGWGIAQVPEKPTCFYLTDGTNRVRMFELRENIKKAYLISEFFVKDGEHPVGMLNEIEVVHDEIWANIFFSEVIAKINRHTGVVTGYLDLREILQKSDITDPKREIDVLNGIAYNFKSSLAYVTGKLWPKVIAVHPQREPYAAQLEEAGIDPFFLDPAKVRYIFEKMLV